MRDQGDTMNLPQFRVSLELAMTEYENECVAAKERLLKALAIAREKFFEAPETIEEVQREKY